MFAKSSSLSGKSNSKSSNEQRDRFFTSITQVISCSGCFWWWIGVMLPCHIGLKSQHTVNLSLSQNVHQILCHILKKYLKPFMLLMYLHSTKSLFQRNFSLQQIFPWSSQEYTGCFKKSKFKGIFNLLPKLALITFCFVKNVIAVSSAFFASTQAFRPFDECVPSSSLPSCSLSLKEGPYKFHRYVICRC